MGDLLRELDAVAAGTTKTDAATQRLLDRLQETLGHALRLVRACKDSGCPLSLLAGGRISGEFDDVDGEIDRCLLDLGVANRILIARLEKQLLLHRRQDEAAGTETAVTLRVGMPRDDNADDIQRCIRAIQASTSMPTSCGNPTPILTESTSRIPATYKSGGEWEEAGDKTVATGNVAAIGVPLHTVTAGVPPPSYGHGYWPYDHGRRTGGGCCHCNAAGPSGAAAANNYSQYPDMFSDENPNAYCAIM
ncbi:hypothetical protein QOZ80_5AG0366270 [Eleusine coracana subsp. coracana]|nr:hypothetical protein QOZ80_5AG0366270 [Eleusine coracana subsp. coracana]